MSVQGPMNVVEGRLGNESCDWVLAGWVLGVEMERSKRWRLEGTALLLYVYSIWEVVRMWSANQATASSTQHPSSLIDLKDCSELA